jgi:hypothetical protein
VTVKRIPTLSIILLALCAVAGCSTRPKLTVNTLEQKKTFAHSFTQVYATRSPDGDYDVVLLDNPIDDAKAGPAGEALKPQAVRPLRHLVHIHVMWTPMIGAKGDSAAATNAAINWYVWGDATGTQADMMQYGGTGFVKIYAGDTDADFSISNAVLKLKTQRGKMTDPIGTASLDGKFTAPLNDQRVKELLAELGQEIGGPRITRIDSYPPSRTVEP